MRLLPLKFFFRAINISDYPKFLLIINTSIFLCIFAICASFISIYFEIKINTKEYELKIESESFRSLKTQASYFPLVKDTIINYQRSIENAENYKSFIYNIPYFNEKFSQNDFYIISIQNYKKFITEFDENINPLITEIFEYTNEIGTDEIQKKIKKYKTEEKELQIISDKLNLSNLKIKEYGYEKDLFQNIFDDFTAKHFDDFKDKHEGSLNSLSVDNYTIDEIIYLKSFYERKFENTLLAIDIMEYFIMYSQLLGTKAISNIADEIENLSSIENKLILSAFILQVIIFLILQFFEIRIFEGEITK